MDFLEQAHQHTQLREMLETAIERRESIDASPFLSERACELGLWLEGEGRRRWAGNQALLSLFEAHRAFHKAASSVAALINEGRYGDAQRALRTGSPFVLAHADLTAALRRMKTLQESLAA